MYARIFIFIKSILGTLKKCYGHDMIPVHCGKLFVPIICVQDSDSGRADWCDVIHFDHLRPIPLAILAELGQHLIT